MVTKILLFLLIFSILIVLRELVSVSRGVFVTGKYKITNRRLIVLGLAISYIVTIIFTGLTL